MNKILALNYPSLESVGPAGHRMVAPFVKLTIGDYVKNQPGYFETIKPSPIENTPWVLKDNMRLPMYMEVECSFVMIGDKVPELLDEQAIIDSGVDRNKTSTLGVMISLIGLSENSSNESIISLSAGNI